LSLPNGVPEVGKYLIHITLHKDNGERLDAHMSFRAGTGAPTSTGSMLVYLLIALAVLYVFYLSNEGFKKKVDSMIGNATKLK
jgi:predicted PurR-regulated permease PerM